MTRRQRVHNLTASRHVTWRIVHEPPFESNRGSYKSKMSTCSVCSVLAVCSAMSFGSVLSLVCVGSVLSAFSISSSYSLASVASYDSTFSIGSRHCTLGFFQNCNQRYAEPAARIDIRLSVDTWDLMSSCSKSDYRNSKKVSIGRCESLPALCEYRHEGKLVYNDTCAVRRRDASSWRDIDDKPSLEVGFNRVVSLATFDCSGEACPVGGLTNNWTTDRVFLNNQARDTGEIDAYRVFRESVEYMGTPLAMPVQVNLFQDLSLVSEHQYALVETIGDPNFMRKWFGPDYILFKVDSDFLQLITNAGTLDDDSDVKVSFVDTVANRLSFESVNKTQILRFLTGEALTAHWDGACLNKGPSSNFYMAFSPRTNLFHFIPSGMDQTFQGCKSELLLEETPMCAPVMRCFAEDANCQRDYERMKSIASLSLPRRKSSCASQAATAAAVSFVTFACVLVATAMVNFMMFRQVL